MTRNGPKLKPFLVIPSTLFVQALTVNRSFFFVYLSVISQPIFIVPEFQGASLEDIARMKAQTAHDRLKAPVIIEDTALAFDALNGLPGAYIKWFLDAIKCEGLAKMLDGFDNRSGSAICTIAYHK